MAFRFDHSDELGDMADINVTPLVDVMLVLLVIFMVTAPMLTQGLTVALPSAEGKSFELASNNPSKIQVTASGAVYLDVMNHAGVEQLGMVTQPKETNARSRR